MVDAEGGRDGKWRWEGTQAYVYREKNADLP
jgi:hypothetical protein